MKCAVFILVLFWIRIANAVSPPAPVFTGTLTHDRLGSEQNVRLVLLNYFLPGAANAEHRAIFSLYQGNLDGPEQASLYYDDVRRNAQTQEYFLLPPIVTEASGRLPTIRFRFTGADTIEGEYTSPTAGFIGRIRLQRGLAVAMAPRLPILKSLAGFYSGDCPYGSDGSKFHHLQIVPSRGVPSTPIGPETALNTVNYLASASCYFSGVGGALGCGAWEPGYLDFYRGEVHFLDPNLANWSCRREGPDRLNCRGRWISNCVLTREIGAETRQATPVRTTVSPPLGVVSVSAPTPASSACGSWDGNYRGILRHHNSGREQYIDIRLSTILIEGPQPPVKCAMLGNAELTFGDDPDGRERITYNIPHFEFIPNRPEQILFTDQESDLILQVSQNSAGKIEGNWFSKFYGLVGEFAAVQGFSGRATNTVPGLAGQYHRDSDRSWTLSLSAIPALSDRKNRNPYHQLRVSGWEDFGVSPLPVEVLSYDYLTNWIVTATRGRFNAGPISSDGMRLETLLRTYMGIPGGEVFFRPLRVGR